MSGYFDGLMRASGLPLGNAPVLGAAPRDAAPLTEIDVAVAAAAPIGPLDVSASAAAYGAAAGIEVIVVLPRGQIAIGKLLQALMAGARVVAIDGNFDQALNIVRALAEQDDHPVTLVNSVNPFRLEGQKTAAFEICDDLGRAPDILAIPVGNAGNISAYWAGFRDYAAAGLIGSTPRMWGFQAAGAAPLVVGHRIDRPETVATAIRIGDPASWTKAIDARDGSGGRISAVTDEEILAAYRALARFEGIFCEPASAASVAGVHEGRRGRRGRSRCDRRVRPDRPRAQGPDDRRAPGPAVPRGPADRRRGRRRARLVARKMAGHWLAERDGSGVTVEVPASSANLGAGYDCLGLALALTNRIELEVRVWSRGEIELTVEGEGRNELTEDRDNRFVRGLEAALVEARGKLPDGVGWRIAMHNQIPLSRGLGSSAAATVGGRARRERAGRRAAFDAELLRVATDIEGHPDNAAASLLGGFVVVGRDREGVEAIRFALAARPAGRPVHPRAAPGDRRRCARPCPTTVPLADAVANLGAVAVGVAGLATGRYDLLARLTVDRLHEPYRAAIYPQLPRMVEAAREAGRARRLPVGGRLDDPRLRRLDGRDHPDRGRVLRRRRRCRPAGAGPGRRAAECRSARVVSRGPEAARRD